jgi:hypothetical protein
VWALAARPAEAVPLLREALRREVGWAGRLKGLIADAGRGRPEARAALEEMGRLPLASLRDALGRRLEAGPRATLTALTRRLEAMELIEVELRVYRAVEVLGLIGTPEALALRMKLAFDRPRPEEP